jgi:hypothetical protein
MKTTILVLIVFVSLAFSIGCDVHVVPKSKSFQPSVLPELKIPFYIFIQQNDKVWEYGKFKYSVQKGDVLKVFRRKTCRGGHGECWLVENVKTGVTGAVVALGMKQNHTIRQEPKQ